ncbi:MAG: hypothetical protein WDO56_19645 [Gammaproteobacteria bacterium]
MGTTILWRWVHGPGDGRSVVVANTFAKGQLTQAPCVAVVDVRKGSSSCVLRLPEDSAKFRSAGIHRIMGVRFEGSGSRRVAIDVMPSKDGLALHEELRSLHFRQGVQGEWQPQSSAPALSGKGLELDVNVRQGLNEPPVLIVSDPSSGISAPLLAPNSFLQEVDLGEAKVMHWTDKKGDRWIGGLVTPLTLFRVTDIPWFFRRTASWRVSSSPPAHSPRRWRHGRWPPRGLWFSR